MKLIKSVGVAALAGLAFAPAAGVCAEDAGVTGVHGYTPKGYRPVKEPAVLENIERFRDMKLGLMMHFGVYSQVGIDESWPLVDTAVWRARQMTDMGVGDEFKRNYLDLHRTFNPIRFDADAWARAAQTNGFRYLCFTTKHHDGFCMWDTKYTDYKITSPECPYSRRPNADMVRAIWDAFRKRGMAISCYFSKADWHHPDYWEDHGVGHHTTWFPTYSPREQPEKWARFREFTRNQMLELCRDYGRIEIMWLDGAAVGCRSDTKIRMDEIIAECRKIQPWLIAADRCCGGEGCENLITPEQTVPEKPCAVPWESCITMASNWSYRYDDEYKDPRTLIHLLIGVVAKGGCLVLNVAPRPDGVIPEPALKRMNEMGRWLRANGEAIYATRPYPPYSARNWAFTQSRKGVPYAIRMTRDGERDLHQVVFPEGFRNRKVVKAVHLATGIEFTPVDTEDGQLIRFPEGFVADPYAEAFRLTLADD